jgi:hypothetical protein
VSYTCNIVLLRHYGRSDSCDVEEKKCLQNCDGVPLGRGRLGCEEIYGRIILKCVLGT